MKLVSKIMIFFLCILLVGCNGKTELDDLAYVIAMGADLNPGGDNREIQITYQIAIPIKITGEGNETGKETFTTYTTTAPSLSIANSKMNTMTSKEIDLSHVSLILYSKELAQKGLEGHVNSLISNVALRPKTIVSVCEGSAKEFLENVTPILETSPARYYELLISSFHNTSRSTKTQILDFYTASQSSYKSPSAVISKLTTTNEAQFSGIAAFHGLNYVGDIDETLVMGHLLLAGNMNKSSISIPCPNENNKTITLTIKELKKPKIQVWMNEQIPMAKIELFVEAHLDSTGNPTNFYDKNQLKYLQNLTEEHIKNTVSEYLKKTIELDTDTSGLGRFAKQNYLTWPEFEKIHWKDQYHLLQYEIKVNCNINISQVISNSIPISK